MITHHVTRLSRDIAADESNGMGIISTLLGIAADRR